MLCQALSQYYASFHGIPREQGDPEVTAVFTPPTLLVMADRLIAWKLRGPLCFYMFESLQSSILVANEIFCTRSTMSGEACGVMA